MATKKGNNKKELQMKAFGRLTVGMEVLEDNFPSFLDIECMIEQCLSFKWEILYRIFKEINFSKLMDNEE